MIEIKSIDNAKVFWSNVYAHGKLESLIGTDLIGSTEEIPAHGIYPATYQDQLCLAFIWQGMYSTVGLVVLTTDANSIDFATVAFNEKRRYL